MNTYILERVTPVVGYDEYSGFVIVAPNEETARSIANERSTPQEKHWKTWTDPAQSSCNPVDTTQQGVVLLDFRAA